MRSAEWQKLRHGGSLLLSARYSQTVVTAANDGKLGSGIGNTTMSSIECGAMPATRRHRQLLVREHPDDAIRRSVLIFVAIKTRPIVALSYWLSRGLRYQKGRGAVAGLCCTRNAASDPRGDRLDRREKRLRTFRFATRSPAPCGRCYRDWSHIANLWPLLIFILSRLANSPSGWLPPHMGYATMAFKVPWLHRR